MKIILKYHSKFDVENICESCFDGFQAIELIKNDVKQKQSEVHPDNFIWNS
jgi:hypothetical protein